MKARNQSLLRSLFVQSVWNYRGMQHIGFLWSLLPLLPKEEASRKAAMLRGFEFYNGHPYLCGYLLGASQELEAAGEGDKLSRLKRAAISPIGASGDRIFWAGLKPLMGALACITLLPLAFGGSGVAGIGWMVWLPLLLCVAYNVIHLRFRHRALKQGCEQGLRVHEAIRLLAESRSFRRIPRLLAFVAGFGGALLLLPAASLLPAERSMETIAALGLLFLLSWQLPSRRAAFPVLLLITCVYWLMS